MYFDVFIKTCLKANQTRGDMSRDVRHGLPPKYRPHFKTGQKMRVRVWAKVGGSGLGSGSGSGSGSWPGPRSGVRARFKVIVRLKFRAKARFRFTAWARVWFRAWVWLRVQAQGPDRGHLSQ